VIRLPSIKTLHHVIVDTKSEKLVNDCQWDRSQMIFSLWEVGFKRSPETSLRQLLSPKTKRISGQRKATTTLEQYQESTPTAISNHVIFNYSTSYPGTR